MIGILRRGTLVVVAVTAMSLPAAAQQPDPPAAARRAELEARVLDEFLARAAPAAGMSADQQARVRAILQESAQRHRERTQAGARLRRELMEAVRAPATPDAAFTRIMQQIEALRAQEQEAWQADQRAIAGVLSPRQRASFSLRWMNFQESVRAMMGARRPRGRGTPGGPPG